MLAKKIRTHPNLVYFNEMEAICRPLMRFNISYFAHVHIDNKNRFTAITNNARFMEHYLSNQYYNVDIHQADQRLFKDFVIWDAIEPIGKSMQMHEEAATFGVKHTFSMLKHTITGKDVYHFATHLDYKDINQVYLTQLDQLQHFINYFTATIQSDAQLSKAYEIPFQINRNSSGYHIKAEDTVLSTTDEIIYTPQIVSSLDLPISFSACQHFTTLSRREKECLYLYINGKTAKYIAHYYQLSCRTVENYIQNIKCKLRVSSKADLIMKVLMLKEDEF